MNNKKRYQELASKWLDGTITEAEKIEFSHWYNDHNDDVDIPRSFAADEEELRMRILNKINNSLSASKPTKVLRIPRKYIAIAASLALFFLFGGYLWYSNSGSEQAQIISVNEVQPGGNKAKLTFADGQEVDLSEQHTGLIVGDDIVYIDGSMLFDDETDKSTSFAILSTPRGGQYQIQLPDGSQVWLNSSSSLKFPKKFDTKFRAVELLSGEAFFEINTQYVDNKKIPFYVKNDNQLTEVLGTKFNVNMYEQALGTITTVTEGSVGVRSPHMESNDGTVLTKGEQSILKGQDVYVSQVNTDEFTAWKDGYFYFNDASIYTVMAAFERWYDIEVQYTSAKSDYLFVGKIPRNVTLGTALNVLKSAGVSYEWKDNRYLIIK
ncbi:MAG TPA: FecR domain-containing protein [Sphingobacterium sp.]|nr:FecR domain-containing protein [Sphingobacterium sp.]